MFVDCFAIRSASREKAILSQREVGVSLVADGGPMARLPRLIGRNRALEVLLSSEDIRGEQAEAYGYARLIPDDQRRALAECFPHHRTAAALLKDKKAEAVTVRELRQWIEREIHLDLTNAPFDTQDDTLLPAAGSCLRCPKRTGTNPLLFPEAVGQKKSICTDRAC